ncbi:hypothetical protein ABZ770_23820 [Streptomyces sp. NPDC006654]|uniref:hypothetical protein n=1 Tax=Streptomyces sp. NPDC006654 TaxID=3156897 RepID=UPI0033E5F2CC
MMLLLALRVTVIVHAVSMFLQPVLAGMFLSGRDDMIDSHATNAAILTSITLFLTVLAAVGRRRRLVGPRAVPILLGLFVLEIAQLTAGTQHLLWLHIPLGVALFGATIATLPVLLGSQRAAEPKEAEA